MAVVYAGFNDNLTLGGPVPIGARKANLSDEVQMHMEEVALNEQGHALFTRQVLLDPCCKTASQRSAGVILTY